MISLRSHSLWFTLTSKGCRCDEGPPSKVMAGVEFRWRKTDCVSTEWLEDDDIHQLHPGRQSAARLIVGLSDWKASKKHHQCIYDMYTRIYIYVYIILFICFFTPLYTDSWVENKESAHSDTNSVLQGTLRSQKQSL